jgi:hypothetical protein
VDNEKKDWTRISEPEEWLSGWAAFHDGVIHSIDSDRLQGTVAIDLKVGFPGPPFDYPERVGLAFAGVTAAQIFAFHYPPDAYADRYGGSTREELLRRSRVETIGLREFSLWCESQIHPEGVSSDISDAHYAIEPATVWLKLIGIGNGADYATWSVEICAASVEVVVPNENKMSLGELLEIGRAGWDNFGSKAPYAKK